MTMTKLAAAAIAAALSVLPVSGVQAQSAYRHAGEARACEDTHILSKIIDRFRHQVRNVPNLPDVEIREFRLIHEQRNHIATEDWPVPRRYCGATVDLSDGYSREIWYLIEGGMGLASIGDNVEFCVAGFDRWYVYNGRCRVLR